MPLLGSEHNTRPVPDVPTLSGPHALSAPPKF